MPNLFRLSKAPGGKLSEKAKIALGRLLYPDPHTGPCLLCGETQLLGFMKMCQSCQGITKTLGDKSIEVCGGCGCGFLLECGIQVIIFEQNGVTRELCASCVKEFRSRKYITPHAPSLPEGYDFEGQTLLEIYPEFGPHEIRRYRSHQKILRGLLESKAKRLNKKIPDPLFTEKEADRQSRWEMFNENVSSEEHDSIITVAVYLWKSKGLETIVAYKRAARIVFLEKHGDPQEKSLADKEWTDAVCWSVDVGLDFVRWKMEILLGLSATGN